MQGSSPTRKSILTNNLQGSSHARKSILTNNLQGSSPTRKSILTNNLQGSSHARKSILTNNLQGSSPTRKSILTNNLQGSSPSLLAHLVSLIHSIKFTYTSIHTIDKSPDIPINNILTQPIRNNIANSLTNRHTVTIRHNATIFTFIIYMATAHPPAASLVHAIAIRMLAIQQFVRSSRLPNLTIYYLRRPKRIQFLKKMSTLYSGAYEFRVEDINTGYCNQQTNTIVLFRQEEMLKVLVHELVHYYGLDRYSAATHALPHDIQLRIGAYYGLPQEGNRYSFNEAKTEALAVILHIIFEHGIEELDTHISRELAWNIRQIAKVILLTTKDRNIWKTFEGIAASGVFTNLRQQTCVFSYFVIKTLLLLQDGNLLGYHDIDKYYTFFTNDSLLTKELRRILKEMAYKMDRLPASSISHSHSHTHAQSQLNSMKMTTYDM
jgi:hypothetical protein